MCNQGQAIVEPRNSETVSHPHFVKYLAICLKLIFPVVTLMLTLFCSFSPGDRSSQMMSIDQKTGF